MFRGSRIDRRILLVPALSALISLSAPAITLPPGFSDNLVAAVGAPTALAFTPDGRLLITSQGGDLRVVTPSVGAPAGNVSVASGFAAGNANLVIDVTGWWR